MNVASQYLPLVAHHEAGHAVAAIVLHRQTFDDDHELPAFSSVSIYPDVGDGECGGVVEGAGFYSAQGFTSKRKPIFEDDMDRCLERDDAIREIVACLAGPFAESAFEGYLDPRDMAMNASDGNEGSSDYADAKRIYGELRFLMPRRPDWGRIEDCTARLVLDHWSAIEALAAHLLVKHDLQFDEALTIVAPHLPPMPAATPPERHPQPA
ncbi:MULTISPECIES: hypothetical protein [unclassified Mesorhizobium]|uniref:hypothetical protein n=7 Tax=Mesorhizobium TaxID=68287 RepID=UPI000FE80D65|nr:MULTISPECIES: hypothetical protein [unclassified Mesorhizobium]MDF3169789.1 hypothetical protein [Mesorhizobium sp. P16.1]MDF3186703.1 hypothetical protein [Mesorhizobium sp. ICCV3110.1]RWG07624.1 MAG: hypothetical protein EOQ54_03115 [Mesorhizobium sp.]RWG53354.1 MAG: hypothetical protein EOQ63_00535 [Mesorhizobium sp.]RWG58685.1 MAG: hypothetical protein EOQ65_19665 [Mesorhizobium sp.]